MTFALVFPGQGSQSQGMLAALGAEPQARSTFAAAARVLGYDLWELTQSGPAERLNETEYTQPAMLAAGIALWRVWRQRGGPEPAVVAGHSLGEFTALVCAGALELEVAIELVRFRGRVMQEAVPSGSGAMAAILGLSDVQVLEACQTAAASGGVVEPVNFNGPGQVVIAGERAAVERATQEAKRLGAKRALMLSISVPAHSTLMRPAAERLAKKLDEVALTSPRITYLSAADVQTHSAPEDIRQLLVRQLASPVRWQETVQALLARNARQLIECGPGKVLTGLNRRIAGAGAHVQCLAMEDSASIDAALASTRESGDSHA
ncbi:MAG TPA: ACP S-malonyltransferase [Steroidobacteraceae bacterium]|nr:ACP S-malonyltransferase [Steroidobacteraceae bacterium]